MLISNNSAMYARCVMKEPKAQMRTVYYAKQHGAVASGPCLEACAFTPSLIYQNAAAAAAFVALEPQTEC